MTASDKRSRVSDAEATSASFCTSYKTAGAVVSLLREEGISCDLEGDADARWNTAVLDSRGCSAGNFFVAVQGKTQNGGDYAASAFAQGATAALIERAYKTDARIRAAVAGSASAAVFVDDAREALKALARRVRAQARGAAVIAVTGSAGKTSTKEMLRAMLGAVGNEGNYNTEEGLSVSLLNAPWTDDTHFGVFECGISEPGEMRRLVDILRPDCALITNVGSAHAGYFSSKGAIVGEKLSVACLLPPEATAWVPEEDEALFARAQEMLSCTVRTHGPKSCAGLVRIEDCGVQGSKLHFADCADAGGGAVIFLRAIGAVNARNAIAALCVADFFAVPRVRSAQALGQFLGMGRRYEVLCEEPLVIDDSYNASTHSVIEALRWFAQHVPAPRMAVLGGMKELGSYSAQEHQTVVDAAAALLSEDEMKQTAILLVGEEYRGVTIAPGFAPLFRRVEDAAFSEAALQNAEEELGASRTGVFAAVLPALFVKGSNAYNLSELARSAARRRGERQVHAAAIAAPSGNARYK